MEPIKGYDDWKTRLPNDEHYEVCPAYEDEDDSCICDQLEAGYVEDIVEDAFIEKTVEKEKPKL